MMVDVDLSGLRKPTLSIDLPVHADLREFLAALMAVMSKGGPSRAQREWLAWTRYGGSDIRPC